MWTVSVCMHTMSLLRFLTRTFALNGNKRNLFIHHYCSSRPKEKICSSIAVVWCLQCVYCFWVMDWQKKKKNSKIKFFTFSFLEFDNGYWKSKNTFYSRMLKALSISTLHHSAVVLWSSFCTLMCTRYNFEHAWSLRKNYFHACWLCQCKVYTIKLVGRCILVY